MNTLKVQVAITAKYAENAQLNTLKMHSYTRKDAQLDTLKVQVAVRTKHAKGAGNNNNTLKVHS